MVLVTVLWAELDKKRRPQPKRATLGHIAIRVGVQLVIYAALAFVTVLWMRGAGGV